jgi:aminoglycoside phosphotransferase (APT) family kinase protein
VYELGDVKVLRRYRDGGPVKREAEVMAYLTGLGYPVPTVLGVNGPDLVMERVTGPTMAETMASGALTPDAAQRILADLHARLHALRPRVGAEPGDRVLHLDLHPENVLMSPRGPVVIDWANTIEGPAEYDVAVTALIYAEVAVNPEHPYAGLAGSALKSFLGYAGVPSTPMIARALALRSTDPALSVAEKSRLPEAVSQIHATSAIRRRPTSP